MTVKIESNNNTNSIKSVPAITFKYLPRFHVPSFLHIKLEAQARGREKASY